MRPLQLAWVLLLGPMALAAGPLRADPADIPALIDKLAEVSEGDIGYGASLGGRSFLPLDTKDEIDRIPVGLNPVAPSATMRQLVKQGVVALPHLIAHLDDRRKTSIQEEHQGSFGSLRFSEEFDRNERTDKTVPPRKAGDIDGNSHTVTVGDLCFVVIGQIVNRRYEAVRYQPTANLIVNSPTRSGYLRTAVKRTWDSLTSEQHRASLVADFLKPDDEYRRIGACKRLAYYYPDALEPLALKFLARTTYSVADVRHFVHEKLYREPDPGRCRALFDAYVARHGGASADGILLVLFHDLDTLEAHEQKRLFPPLTEYADQPRKLLIQLYGKPKDVKSEDRPYVEAASDVARARLIEQGLIYDQSEKVDRGVRGLLVSAGDDDLARACIQRLVGRGYDAEIEAYCRGRLPQVTEEWDRQAVQAILGRLVWTPLHVAVDRNDLDAVRGLLHDRAKVDVPARDGRTPLHVAVLAGNLEAVRLLVEAGASLDVKDREGRTPVQLAGRGDSVGAIRYLAGRGCSLPDVLAAAAAGRAGLVERFLGAEPAAAKMKDQVGRTPLHLAAAAGHTGVVDLLLKRGAAVGAVDDEGRTPLHLAALNGWVGAAERLLAGRAVIEAKDTSRSTALHLAVAGGNATMVQLLLGRGADRTVQDNHGMTPLDLARELKQTEIIQFLERRGTKP